MVDPRLNIENFNNDFLIIKSEDRGLLATTGRSIFENSLDFIDEVIVTEMEVCVQLNDRFEEGRLKELNNLTASTSAKICDYKLPIYFDDNEDWDAVIAYSGIDRNEIISKIIKSPLSVSMFGFLPGFVYLDGLDKTLHIPRKTIPTKYEKVNSIAIGGKYLGIYSIDSPGGWHVIGQIPLSILNLKSLPPLDFNIGDTIRLVTIDQEQFDVISKDNISFTVYNS